MIFKSLVNAGRVALTLSVISLAGYAAVQTVRSNNLAATNREYSQKIVDLEAAQVLTEELRKANADLTAELSTLRTQLKGQAGYDTPLPSGIADVLKRVQSAGQ